MLTKRLLELQPHPLGVKIQRVYELSGRLVDLMIQCFGVWAALLLRVICVPSDMQNHWLQAITTVYQSTTEFVDALNLYYWAINNFCFLTTLQSHVPGRVGSSIPYEFSRRHT